jgi:hypothetical protein
MPKKRSFKAPDGKTRYALKRFFELRLISNGNMLGLIANHLNLTICNA